MDWTETPSTRPWYAADTAPSGVLPDLRSALSTSVDGMPTPKLDAPSVKAEPDKAPTSVSMSASLPAGTRVGDYILKEAIATGGFGVVYRAEHVERELVVALKVLHPELALTREAVLRFEREVQAIRRIDHPNVIRILDFGELRGGRPYFAMELLVGVDLESYLRACGRLSPDEALAILTPVCSALSAAHESAIIHRDFKASNVFLEDQADRRRVVLLDFGVAKVLDDAGPGITTSSHILGTPACMAPEQIMGQPTDVRTDIYALGALAYYMLTGELPFLDASLVALLHMHLYSRPPIPSRVAPVCPAFDDVILKAMAKDPAARYQSAAEFLAAFRAAADEARGAVTPRISRVSLNERRMAAIYLEVCTDAAAMEEPDDALLADMEAILPLAQRVMAGNRFTTAVHTGNTMLLLAELPLQPHEEIAARRSILDAAIELEQKLARREGRDERVHVNLCVHLGPVFTASDKIIGGELLDLGAWVPQVAVNGVIGTDAFLADLDVVSQQVQDAPGFARVLIGARSPAGCPRRESAAI